ncbi:MAG: serine/threonine protein kinase [bacterium]|nr:serine/threonine protein kinase [bacterium]
MPKAGDRVGRYVLEKVLGTGGMGCVFRAFDDAMNRHVAIKIAKDPTPELARHFMQEGKAQSSIRHPHVMPVYDMGFTNDGRPYYVMELLYEPVELTEIVRLAQAGTLAARYPRVRSWRDARQIVKDVLIPLCDAVHVVNQRYGLLHRDLKPSNVLIDIRTRRAHLIDFGNCASLKDEPGTPHVVGTARFLAPEQARGRYHPRTDVWALGALLSYILAGEPPIKASSPYRRAEIEKRINLLNEEIQHAAARGNEQARADAIKRRERVADLRPIEALFQDARAARYTSLGTNTPRMLRSIARKAMSARPEARYETAALMGEDLEAFVQGRSTRAAREQGRRRATAQSLVAGVKNHRLSAMAIAVGLALGAIFGALALGSGAAPHDYRVADVRTDLQALAREVETLTTRSSDAATSRRATSLLWREYRVRLARLRSRLPLTVPGSVATDLRRLEEGLAPGRLQLVGAGTRRWQLEDRLGGSRRTLPASGALEGLAPGAYRLHSDGAPLVALPVHVPLGPPGTIVRVKLPSFPEKLPDEVVFVPAGAKGTGPGVLMTRSCVTCAQYAEWLDDLPPAQREARVPSHGFGHLDRNDASRILALPRYANRAVLGVRPANVKEYLAWQSQIVGAPLRLPTRTEWLQLLFTGEAPAATEAAALAARHRDVAAHYGVRELFDGTGELVFATDEARADLVIVGQGSRRAWIPTPSAVDRQRPVVGSATDDGAFRVVMPLGH